MRYRIDVLHLGDVVVDSATTVLGYSPGTARTIPVLGYLLRGEGRPVVVDTGYSHPAVMQALGLEAPWTPEQALEAQLAAHGVGLADVDSVVHTHLHLDHCGQTRLLQNATAVVNRRELEVAAGAVQFTHYHPDDVVHLVERAYTPGRIRLLDLELSGPVEILPGILAEPAGGHTEGSMVLRVPTELGTATICGDLFYDVDTAVTVAFGQVHASTPAPSANTSVSLRQERAAMARALQGTDVLLTGHDWPAVVRRGSVVGRIDAPRGRVAVGSS